MDASIWLMALSILSNVIIGRILYNQIKSQKAIIETYKGLVEATSPDKIIALHNKEIEQLKRVSEFDKEQLQTIAFELGVYVDYYLTDLYSYDLGKDSIPRETHINRNMPHCSGFLQKIHSAFHPNTPNAK